MKRFSSIVLLMCFGKMGAQRASQDSLWVRIDSSHVAKKAFSESLAEKYPGDEFDYTSVEGETQNIIARAISWFFNKLSELFGFELSPGIYQIVELIVYMALGILVLYLVTKFLLGSTANSFFTRKSAVLSPLSIEEEHIENIDLDHFIKEALAQKDYRLAIRFMYLRTLKQLSWKQIIEWHYDKTNTDYYREIVHKGVKDNFKQVSYLYDYIWYGEFPLDELGFNTAKKDFDRLTKSISNAG